MVRISKKKFGISQPTNHRLGTIPVNMMDCRVDHAVGSMGIGMAKCFFGITTHVVTLKKRRCELQKL